MPKFILPSIVERLAEGGGTLHLCFVLACWMRSLHGIDDLGQPLPINDLYAATLCDLAAHGGADPCLLLSVHAVFGTLGAQPKFVAQLHAQLESLARHGVAATLARLLDSAVPLRA
jgi:mannitol 2-dehydrogenase